MVSAILSLYVKKGEEIVLIYDINYVSPSAGAQHGHHDPTPSLRAAANGQHAREVLIFGAGHSNATPVARPAYGRDPPRLGGHERSGDRGAKEGGCGCLKGRQTAQHGHFNRHGRCALFHIT